MKSFKLRILVALLTFCLGVFVFEAGNFIEDVIVERWSTSVDINSIGVPTTDALESNEVYNVILRQYDCLRFKLFVVQSESASRVVSGNESSPGHLGEQEAYFQGLRGSMPEADADTLRNYLALNRISGPIAVTAPDLNIVLIPGPNSSNLIPFWVNFYKSYPNSSGLIHFSKVGFNNRHDQALVYVARNCGGLCGGSNYVLLTKRNGKWVILRRAGISVY